VGSKARTRPAVVACRAAALIALALVGQSLITSAATTTTVTVKDFAFQPKMVTIRVGDMVTWANVDTATHTVTSNGNWDTGGFAPGMSRSITFGTAGTYQYFCNLHSIMFGTVVVLASDAPSPTPTLAPSVSASTATGPPSTAPPTAVLAALPSSTAAPVVLRPPSQAGPGPVIVAGAAMAIVALFAFAWLVARQI
jgi:plastocyanin